MIKFTWNIKDFKTAKTVLKRKKVGGFIIQSYSNHSTSIGMDNRIME